MIRVTRAAILVWAMLAMASAASAADALTEADRGWLTGNLNLPGDSPALLDLSAAQQARLHALIADRKAGIDRKRQNIVQFLTEATDRNLEQTLDGSTARPGAPTELGANRPR